ncbi:alpha-(1-_3)-arabinofuranosyltransferase [Jiangella sp. DSM 45060]|uniref:alpha-(1->3)-arabinofuranosyltransferase n=1 Tax=Jiangella sp. DSM 45060 TaxID=1798224 RepID=UPI00087B59D6|nr:alpha-(1->3)-arabinofuranosyltransferase [Jiangella sp. DSM 45060]SDS78472.1 arabinofuranan 3-O-arabinosyltransferase [Jiangella sp. DSM 45060]
MTAHRSAPRRRLPAWRVQLVVCCLGLVALAFRQAPGQIVPDTKLDLTADPGGFLQRALHLWEPAAAFGQLQNQAYGYLWPMGPLHLAGDVAGLPAWAVQRLWWSLILVAAFLGVVKLAGELGVGRSWTRLLGGLVYALAPRILVSLGAVSVEAWPTALAPWALLPLVRAWRGGPVVRNAALSAIAVLCMGGVNAAATAAAVVPAGLWLLLAPHWPGRWRFAAWWVGCCAAVTVWWWVPLLLLGSHSPPFLDWIETAGNTTQHTSLIEVLRGNDHWLSYLSVAGGPQWPAGWLLASEPVLILHTVLIAAIGLGGLARRDMPGRRVLLTGAVAGLALVSAGYLGAAAGPLAGTVRELLDGPLAPFRNVHKFDVVLRLPLALGLAHALAMLRVPAISVRRFRVLVVGLAVVVIAGVATPALAGRLPQAGSYDAIPDYWHEASDWLDENAGTGRALLVPGTSFAEYTWGAPRDEPLQALGDTPWAVRDSVPLSSAGNIRLLDAVEARLAAGEGGAGVVDALRRAGVSHLVVRNDLDRSRTDAPRAALVHQAIADLPGAERVATFGPRTGASDDPGASSDSRLDVRYPAVEVYAIADPESEEHRVAAYPLDGTLRMSGGPESLLTAGDAGLLDGRAAFVAGDGAGIADPHPVPVVTDGLRRRAVWFGASRDNVTEVLRAGEDGGLGRVVRDFLPVEDPARETVAVVSGVADVTASSSGADPRATMARGAENSPWAAVDGDLGTSWVSGEYGSAAGQWLELTFDEPRRVPSVELTPLTGGPVSAPMRRVAVQTDTGILESDLSPADGAQVLAVPSGETTTLRVSVVAVGEGTVSGVGIRELAVPDLKVLRTLAAPAVTAADLGGPASGEPAPATLVFAVADGRRGECVATTSGDARVARCAGQLARPGEENRDLRRSTELAAAAEYEAELTARPRPGRSLEELLAPDTDGIVATASSRAVTDPLGRPQAAVDRDPGTGWVAAPDDEEPSLTLTWGPRRTVEGLRLEVEPWLAASRPSLVEVRAGETRFQTGVDGDGVVTFPEPVRTDELTVTIVEVAEVEDRDPAFGLRSVLPPGVSEVEVLGADDLRLPVDESRPVVIACGDGPALDVGGSTVTTRVETTVGDLLRGRRLDVLPCGDGSGPVALDAGAVDVVVRATGALRPESATLRPVDAPPEPPPSLAVTVQTWDAAEREVVVPARDEPAVLAVTENLNTGWQASLNGESLEPVRLDGWAQGFVLPVGAAGVVELTYAPDRPYRWALLAGLGAVLVVGVLAWRGTRVPAAPSSVPPQRVPSEAAGSGSGGGRRKRRTVPLSAGAPVPLRAPVAARPLARHRRQRAAPIILLGAAVLVLLGGAAGLAAAAVGTVVLLAGPGRPRLTRLAPALAAGAVLLAGIVVALRPWPGPSPGAHSGLAQGLVLIAIALAVIGSVAWQRPGTVPEDDEFVRIDAMLDPEAGYGTVVPEHRRDSTWTSASTERRSRSSSRTRGSSRSS